MRSIFFPNNSLISLLIPAYLDSRERIEKDSYCALLSSLSPPLCSDHSLTGGPCLFWVLGAEKHHSQ